MTVQEIAEIAGVSAGTVDRVLHNRKGVSQKTKEKIQSIIEEYHYKPNLIARQLKNNTILKIGVLLPKLDTGCGYYKSLLDGMKASVDALQPFKIDLLIEEFNRLKPLDAVRKGAKLISKEIDALIATPVVQEDFYELIPLLYNTPYIFIDSPLNYPGAISTIAQNPFKGGYCAGKIMKLLKGSGSFACIRMYDNAYNLSERARGFSEYFSQDSGSTVYDVVCKDFTEVGLYTFLEEFYVKHKDLKGIFIPHAEVQLATHFLLYNGLKNKITLIGFDCVSQNKQALQEGTIDCLIGQRPELQGAEAVRQLYIHLMLHKDIANLIEMPIDIFFKENI
jgi:LacI family transcriptional regulator